MVIIAAAAVHAAVRLRNRRKKREMREGMISSDRVLNEAGGGGSTDSNNPSDSNWWRGDGGSYSATAGVPSNISSSVPSSASPADVSSYVQPVNAHGSPSASSSMSSGSPPVVSQGIAQPSSTPLRGFASESASGSNSSEEEQKRSGKSDSAAIIALALPAAPVFSAIEAPAVPPSPSSPPAPRLGLLQSGVVRRKHSAPPGSFAATVSASASSSLPVSLPSSSALVSVSAPTHPPHGRSETLRRKAMQPEAGSFSAAMDNSSSSPDPKPESLLNRSTASPVTPETVTKTTRSQRQTSMQGSFVAAMTTSDAEEDAVGTDTAIPTETIAAAFANSSINRLGPGSATAAPNRKLSRDPAAPSQGIGGNAVAVSRPRPRSNADAGSFVSEMSRTLPPRLQSSAIAPIHTSTDETSRTSASIAGMKQPSGSIAPESVSGSFSAAVAARRTSGASLSGSASPQPVEGSAAASALRSRRAKRGIVPAEGSFLAVKRHPGTPSKEGSNF